MLRSRIGLAVLALLGCTACRFEAPVTLLDGLETAPAASILSIPGPVYLAGSYGASGESPEGWFGPSGATLVEVEARDGRLLVRVHHENPALEVFDLDGPGRTYWIDRVAPLDSDRGLILAEGPDGDGLAYAMIEVREGDEGFRLHPVPDNPTVLHTVFAIIGGTMNRPTFPRVESLDAIRIRAEMLIALRPEGLQFRMIDRAEFDSRLAAFESGAAGDATQEAELLDDCSALTACQMIHGTDRPCTRTPDGRLLLYAGQVGAWVHASGRRVAEDDLPAVSCDMETLR